VIPADVEVRYELAEDAGEAQVDPVQISRVLANLVRNAVEAMPSGGVVVVRSSGSDGEVRVIVRDCGEGIDGDVLPNLFEPLQTTKAVGTGLGLALSRAIVEAHGGTIDARNLSEGGAEFKFTLPRTPRGAP
jgi:signal transduction histidine kinase